MKQADFRAELVKIMPGYKWVVNRTYSSEQFMIATGTQSSGSNRLSTLEVVRRVDGKAIQYEARSAGYGRRAPWLHCAVDSTLARALRNLQDHYEAMARSYSGHVGDLQRGRTQPQQS